MSKCSEHPLAPHGFDRNGSHEEGRYVCDCEGWTEPTPVYSGDNIPCWPCKREDDDDSLSKNLGALYDSAYTDGIRASRAETRRIIEKMISDLKAWRARL